MSNKNTSGNLVIKAGFGYIIGNYLLKGITFMSAPIFSRLMSTSDFGVYNTYISYESIIYILVGLAIHSSLNNAKYKYKDNFNSYVSSCVLLIILSTSVWLIIANIFYSTLQPNIEFSRAVINILIIQCFGDSLLQCYNTYASLNYSYKSYVKISSINALTNMVLSIILMISFMSNNRSDARILGTAIPIICIGIYISVFFFRKAKPTTVLRFWKYGIKYSLPIIPHGISQIILSSFDRIMINNMVGASEAGLYSFSYTIFALLKVAANSLENIWKPWIYEKLNSKNYASIRKHGTNYAIFMALLTAIVSLTAPEIIMILGAREYWESADCIIPILIGGYFSFLYTLPVLVEYFYEKTKYIAVGTVSAAILNIILNYICIPRFGYIAAAYTTLVTYFLYFLFHYLLSIKIHGSELFSSRAIFSISFAIIFVGAVALCLSNYWFIRWFLTLIIFICSVYYANKTYNIILHIKKRLNQVK